MSKKYDFGGWATKNSVLCADGLTIMPGAFAEQDGKEVPLVWMHSHNDPTNTLGHAVLENRDDGVYAWCTFNDTEKAQHAKELVKHRDVTALSIFANKLKKNGRGVAHGIIREVSLVLAGANPGAMIDNPDIMDCAMAHSEDTEYEAWIGTVDLIPTIDILEHSDIEEKENSMTTEKNEQLEATATNESAGNTLEHADEPTVADIVATMNEDQKTALYFLLTEAIKNSNNDTEGDTNMSIKHNAFEDTNNYRYNEEVISHDAFSGIIASAKRAGSLKEAFGKYMEENNIEAKDLGDSLQHGITNISTLFPDFKLEGGIQFYDNPDEWVKSIMAKVHHSPTAKVSSMYSDLTPDEARARGYIKGTQKVEEVIEVAKRSTEPTTIYKLQKFDRDDLLDITEFEVVAMIKAEMRTKLNEEWARATLIGDGRSSSDPYKVKEDKIRPIWTDNEMFAIHTAVKVGAGDTDAQKAEKFMDDVIRARREYRGSGEPDLYCAPGVIDELLLLKDGINRYIWESRDKIATRLGVRNIYEVNQMIGKNRTVDSKRHDLVGIIVNYKDYGIGMNKGGEATMFDDFDINFNKYEYLIETRMSGALRKIKSAMVFEYVEE